MQNLYGCGVNSPNQTLVECTRNFTEKIKTQTADEIKSTRDENRAKFKNTLLSKEIDAKKVANIEFFLKTSSDSNLRNSPEGQTKLVRMDFH